MGFYSSLIFPRLCEWALDNGTVAKERDRLLAGADGQILEIGIGTALNIEHFPPSVRKITAIDPNPGMQKKAAARIAQSGIEVDKRLLGGESLPFDAGSFDTVVSTFTLCSIAKVEQALAEIFRVLRPGGKFLFLEHGLSPDAGVQRCQRRLNSLQRFLADNCHLDRAICQLVESQPYSKVDLEEGYLPKMPRTHGYVSRGTAIK
jgi:ubiquinone/menaquinone biosynthesis C-methylase UbiE